MIEDNRTLERDTQHEILKAWGAHPRLRLWRANTGAAQLGERTVRFGTKGQADISGIIAPNGRRLEIEVKSPTGKQTPAQRAWQAMIERHGGVYILAKSLADVDLVLVPLVGPC